MCDKIAITASSAMTYTVIWTGVSVLVMGCFAARVPRDVLKKAIVNPHTIVQAVLWAGAFFSQMAGVQYAFAIPSGVTYVKLLTMLNVLITVAVGGALFSEGRLRRSLAASGFMVAGAVVAVVMR